MWHLLGLSVLLPRKKNHPQAHQASLVDEVALTQAVEGFTAGDEASVAELAAVVAPEAGVDVDTATHVSLDAGELVLASDEAVGEDGDDLAIGISYAGALQEPAIVDGVAVSAQVEQSLDIVMRAIGDGAQVLAVLADENAPTELAFDLNLPEGASLVQNFDGSIDVFAPIETEVPLPGEEARVEAAVAEILGESNVSLDDLDLITDDQLVELIEIPELQTRVEVLSQAVATLEAPWAVDAEGNAVETSYNLVDGTLVQTVVTDENTVFPVVADPSIREIAWWTATSLSCAAAIVAVAVPATALYRAARAAKKIADTAKKAAKASNAVKAVGGPQKAAVVFLKNAINDLRRLVISGAKKLSGKAQTAVRKMGEKLPQYQLTSQQKVLISAVGGFGVYQTLDVFGVGSCGQILRALV